jgi:hypothetical protein
MSPRCLTRRSKATKRICAWREKKRNKLNIPITTDDCNSRCSSQSKGITNDKSDEKKPIYETTHYYRRSKVAKRVSVWRNQNQLKRKLASAIVHPPLISSHETSQKITRQAASRAASRDSHARRIHVPSNAITAEDLLRKLQECSEDNVYDNTDIPRRNNPNNGETGNGNGGGDDPSRNQGNHNNNNTRRNNNNDGGDDGGDGGDGGDSFFDDLLKSPTKALILLYLNSGLLRFHQYKNYNQRWNGQDVDIESLSEEINQEALTDEELFRLVSKFLRCHSFTSSDAVACGCCGLIQFERLENPSLQYKKLCLTHPIMALIQYTAEEKEAYLQVVHETVRIPTNDRWDMEEVFVWQCKSVFVKNDRDPTSQTSENIQSLWHLHPELVNQEAQEQHSTRVCPDCWKSLSKRDPKRPDLSIAKGIDFGFFERIKQLVQPTFFELLILARTRLFFATMKVTSNERGTVNRNHMHRLKCHAILFPHNAPEIASYMHNSDVFGKDGLLDMNALKGLLQIFLVDHKGNHDSLAEAVFSTSALIARPFVIAQWLLVLQKVHRHYFDLHVESITRLKEIVDQMSKLEQHLRDSATTVSDPEDVAREDQMGSDVAQVQNVDISPEEHIEAMPADAEAHLNVPIAYSYVTNTTEAYLAEDKHDIRYQALQKFTEIEDDELQAILNRPGSLEDQLFDSSGLDEWLTKFPPVHNGNATRSEFPCDDFQDKLDRSITTSFPHIFMLGKAYGRSAGRLSLKQRLHLLNQFTLLPSKNRSLVGFLYDLTLRIQIIDGIKAYVEGNPSSMEAIRHLLENIEEKAKLTKALNFPYQRESKLLINKYMKHFRFASKNVDYGPVEGANVKHKITGYTKRYSASSIFLTFSPDNLSNPRALRLTFRVLDNNKFPATFEPGCPRGNNGANFMENITDFPPLSEGTIALPKAEAAQRSIDNPVAFVMENKQMLFDIITILIGVSIESKGFYARTSGVTSRRTRYYRSHKGLFGYPLCLTGVTEGHNRGTLHWHFNVNAGLCPQLLQTFSSLPEICSQISAVLDKIVRCELPPSVHASVLLKRHLNKCHSQQPWSIPKEVIACFKQDSPLSIRANDYLSIENGTLNIPFSHEYIKSTTDKQAGSQNHHLHQAVCRKGLRGKEGCRLDFDQPCISATVPVRLVPTVFPNTNTDNTQNEPADLEELEDNFNEKHSYKVMPIAPHPYIPAEDPARKHQMCSLLQLERESSVIVWEIKRPLIDVSNMPDIAVFEDSSLKRKVILHSFQMLLSTEVPCTGRTQPFWDWAYEQATTEQLIKTYQHLKDKLPCANGCIATFCPALSYCTGSHNNASFMGSAGQAKAAMFYIIPYESKAKFPLQQSLSIIHASARHVFINVSNATDAGTVQRTVKHFLTRATNRMHLLMEISDWEMAAALVGLPSFIESDTTVFMNPMAVASFKTTMEMSEDYNNLIENFANNLEDNRRIGRILSSFPARRNRHNTHTTLLHIPYTFVSNIQPNPLRKIPMDALRHIVRFLCEDPTDVDQQSTIDIESLRRNFRDNLVHGLFQLDPWLYHQVLKDDICVSATIDFAFDRYQERALSSPVYDHTCAREGLGYIRKLKIGEDENISNPVRHLLFPSSGEYYFRSPKLEDISYFEYQSCFAFKNSPPSDKPDNPLNFKTATQFRMDHRFPAHTNSHQVVRQKQCTPLLVGDIPPFPGNEPSVDDSDNHTRWQEKADRYALFYLAMFRPFSVRNQPPDNWRALVQWIEHNSRSEESSIISTFRLMMMHQYMKGMYFPDKLTQAARDYCSRARHMWTQEESNEFNRQRSYDRANVEFNNRKLNDIADKADRVVTERQKRCIFNQVEFDQKQGDTLATLTCTANNMLEITEPRRSQWQSMLNSTPALGELQVTLSHMQSWRATPDNSFSSSTDTSTSNTVISMEALRPTIQQLRSKLNGSANNSTSQQVVLFDRYTEELLKKDTSPTSLPPMPRIVILDGGAGAGKTTLRNSLFALHDIFKIFIFKLSFNSINAAEMGGDTVCGWIGNRPEIHMHQIGSFDAGIINQLRQRGFNKHSLVAIEEFETCALWHIARLSKLCELANNCDELFGGASVLLIGDFGQLGPVKAGPTITQHIMRRFQDEDLATSNFSGKKRKHNTISQTSALSQTNNQHHPNIIGMEIFLKARLYELTEQKRSLDDVHTSLITKFRWSEKIKMTDLKSKDYSLYSHEDTLSGLWDDASALTCTNRARHTFTHQRALLFATHHSLPVLRWRSNWQNWTNKPEPHHVVHALEDPCFHEYFVKGCGGFFVEKYLPEMKLGNGTSVTYHSLRFHPEHENEAKQIIQHAPPGDVTDLPFPPLMVIVDVTVPSGVNSEVIQALKAYSLSKNAIRIPIQRTTCKWSSNPIPVHGGSDFEPSWVDIQPLFPLQTNFAMTAHRSLGQTLPKIIVPLSCNPNQKHNFSYKQLYVILSRVRTRNDIRLLLVGDNEAQQWNSITYIDNLKPDPADIFYLSGFRDLNTSTPNEGWETNQWCPTRANRMFKAKLNQGQIHI